MPHYDSYQSFQTKKSIDKKNKAKETSANKTVDDGFIISREDVSDMELPIVIETTYKEAKVLFKGKVIDVYGMQRNIPCNQLVFPGDYVILDNENKKITNVIERSTVLSRDHKDRARKSNVVLNKVIATNIDIAVIVVSAYSPPLHPKFIDRYLMILQNCGIEPVICLNKADLKTKEDEMVLDIYKELNIPVIETSALNNQGIELLKTYLTNKRAIFVGHSGVGKSTLTNALMDSDEIKTGNVGAKSLRGRHTTTSSKFYYWEEGSSIIDTPGIRALDVSSFQPSEIQYYFSEFAEYSNCKYRSCDHINVATCDCGIKSAVEQGYINFSRYESYRRIVEDLQPSKKKDKYLINDDITTL